MKKLALSILLALTALLATAQTGTTVSPPAPTTSTPVLTPEPLVPEPDAAESAPSLDPAATESPAAPTESPATDPAAAATSSSPAPAAGTSSSAVSRIFAVNLWTGPVDVKFGQDGLFLTTGLGSNSASQALLFSNFTPRSILFKPSAAESWNETKQESGKILNYAIQAGKCYLILVKANGNVGLYDLGATDSTKPKLTILNNTGKALDIGQIGTGVGAGTKLNFTGIPSGAWSLLADLPTGTFNAYWNYTGLSGPAQANPTKFLDGGFYALILSHDNIKDQSSGGIWDLTPKK